MPRLRPTSLALTAPKSAARFLLLVVIATLQPLQLEAAEAPSSLDWAPFLTHLSTSIVTLPAESLNGPLLVEAMINGSGPFHLLVDTGCSCSIISPAVALAIEARAAEDSAYVTTINSLGDSSTVPCVLLDSIELGGARFEGVTAGVTSLELQSRVTGVRIDGILGYTVFSDLFLTFDFPHQRVQLSRDWPRDLPPVRAELELTEQSAVPFATLTGGNRSYSMMIDTGANGGLFFDIADSGSLAWKVPPRAAGLVAAMGGTGRDWLGRLSGNVALGGVRQTDPVVTVTRGSSRIGTGFLRGYCAVFSRTQHKLWLCSASDAPLPSPPARSIGLSLLADPAGWRVAGTIPDSPAENAHLVPGDVITAIERTPARSWTREDLQQWIDTHETLMLTIARSVGPSDITLPVWALVP